MDKKEDFLDEIMRKCNEDIEEKSSINTIALYDIYVGPWKQFNETENVSLKDILDMVNVHVHVLFDKGSSLRVANNLYLYNSKANIVQAEDKSLIILPEAEVAIDLFHNSKEEFVGTDKDADYYIMEILKAIGRDGYVFYSLNEALSVNTLLVNRKEFPVKCISDGTVVAQGASLFGKPYWTALMNQISHGAHNWTTCMTYSEAIDRLKNQLLNFDVVCYETMAYIKEADDYCIETKVPFNGSNGVLDYKDRQSVAIFACFNPNDPQAKVLRGEIALKYMGMYRFDKDRSEKENYVSFKKCYYDKLYI